VKFVIAVGRRIVLGQAGCHAAQRYCWRGKYSGKALHAECRRIVARAARRLTAGLKRDAVSLVLLKLSICLSLREIGG
jgi:hypothetical protein